MGRIRGSGLGLIAALALSSCAGVTLGNGRAPDVAEIVCEADGTRVVAPAVRVQRDGVHLRVDNRTGGERFIYKRVAGGAHHQHVAPPGTSETVSLEGPGPWEVICSRPTEYPDQGSAWAALEVVDPDAVWVPDRPECEHTQGTHPDYFDRLPKGETGDLLELAERDVPEWMEDPRPGDEVGPAGYPDGRVPTFRAVRDGRVVAVASYIGDGRGGWLFGGIEECVEEQEGVPEPPD